MEIPPADLARIRDLYAQGQYLRALAESAPFGPIRGWAGPAARLIGGRLAIQLGAPKLGRGLHAVAFRENPANLEAVYYHARYRLEMFGPLSCWRFLREHPDWSDAAPDLRADWLALHGFVCGRVRDFDRADKWLTQAEAVAADRAWVLVERASVYEAADRLDDALATARRSLGLQAWFRPAVQAVGHVLQRSGKPASAIDFLTEAVSHLESGMVVAQLAALQLDQNRPADARRSLERYAELTPLIEPEVAKWLAARRADVAYLLGEPAAAVTAAREVKEDFYTAFADNLAARPDAERSTGRTILPVDLDYDGTPPTPYDLLAKFWGAPVPPSDAPPTLDGLPDVGERRRFDAAGWVTHEFTLTATAAADLIGRGVPFFVTLVEAGFGQPRLVVGVDPVRASVFVADGFERRPAEAPVKVLCERYAPFGPRCLVAVPAGHAAKLDGVELPDSPVYAGLYAAQTLLADRKLADGKAAITAFRAAHPDHRLAKCAAIAWARATAHPVLLLDALNAVLADFPHDASLVLSKAAVLRELGRNPERLALLQAEGAKLDAEPLLAQSLAQMLLPDPTRQAEAGRLLRRSVRNRPHAAAGYFLLASQWWEHQRFADAAEAYRFAACLDDREDQFAEAYARVAKATDQGPDALRLFQQKSTRAAVPAPPAVRALFHALLDRDEPEQAFAALGRAISKLEALAGEPAARPDAARPEAAALGELLLFRAETHANFGRPAEADADLTAARPLTPPTVWSRAAARVARTKPDYPGALAHVLELLERDPLNAEAQRIAAGLTAETDGRAAAVRHLAAATTRFPDSYPLARLRAEFLYRDSTDETAVAATEHLLTLCPHDAWAHRQLALVFADRRRHPEALAAITKAGEFEPDHPSHFAVLGHVHRRADRVDEAIAAFREGVTRYPDQELLIAELVQVSRGAKEKKASLRFVAERLHAAPHTGDGLIAYFEQATRLVDDPESQDRLAAELDRFLDERPDLWHCWSLVAQMLVRTHRETEAAAVARDATERFPLLARLWVDLAEAHEAAENADDRVEALRQAVAVAPGWSPVAKELADALADAEDEDGAIAVLTRNVQRNPLDHWARWWLADKLWHADRGREALDQAKAAVRHEPGYDPDRPPTPDFAWNAVIVWSDKLDCDEEAADLVRELTRDRAGDPRQWLRLARHLYEPANAAEALAALDKATALDPKNVEAHDLRAERLAQLGRFDEALEAARPAALETELPLVLQGRAAWVEARRGNYAAAIPPMQALVAVDPEYVWGWQQLAEWYNDTNRPENYLEAAGELCRLRPEHPMSLTMRGEAKLQTGDRDGGKQDLREVLRLYANFSPAAAILFDAHLADGEFRDARSALAILQEHMSGPEVLVKQVQYAARQKDADAAARAFADICAAEGDGPPLFLQMGLAEMRSAGWEERSHELMKEAWQTGDPFNPWAAVYWLDTPAAEDADPDERVAACDAVLKHYPRFVPAYDRRAEQLALNERFDDAAAACTPAGVAPPYPVALRGRAAWVEARRGDRPKAIEMMRQVLAAEPDYAWGWRQLAGWYDATGRHRDFLDAADQLVRLNPDDPFAHGLRGEAKRVVGDHRGAKDDFQRAFDLDPGFDAAGIQLVAEQLATDDLTGAARTLSKLREHADGPLLKLRAVQVAARQGNLAQARAAFKSLGTDPGAGRGIVREAAAALVDAGWAAEADEDLDALAADPTVAPAAAALWAERTIRANAAWKVSDKLPAIVEANRAAGREVAATYTWGMAVADRPDAVAATVQKYADLLREEAPGWARAGAALAESKQFAHAVAWFGEWQDRDGCEPWMVLPLADALRALGRDAEAEAVARWAVEDGDGEPDAPPDFFAWLALTAAVAGKTAEATAHLKAVDPLGLDDGVKLIVAMAQALVRVQRAAPGSKAEAFAESKADLQAAAGACEAKDLPPGSGRWYRKCVDRLTADAGSLSAKLWGLWQRVSPWVREG